jgi:type IV pilus assembly protein PilB
MIKIDQSSEQNILNMLMEHSVVDYNQVKKITEISKESGKTKLEIAFDLNFTDEAKILKILSTSYSLPIVNLKDQNLSDDIKKIIPINYIVTNSLVPFEISGKNIKIAIADASKLSLLKNLKTITGLEPELYAASISDIQNFISRLNKEEKKSNNEDFNKDDQEIESIDLSKLEDVKLESAKEDKEITPIENESDVIKFGHAIITEAILAGASDIHIEPFKKTSRVRYRVDGILNTMDKFAKFLNENYSAVVTRIKILSKLDISEKRLPQDGSIAFKYKSIEVDLRISILPTNNNERVVMRILNKNAGEKKIEQLGFDENDLKVILKAISSSQGMVLVTGPTGSGKTTTLYSILKHINSPKLNILTAEDPVEYEMEGIAQVQVREDIGYTFATALRSFLRQDPEVILIGEIRDKDTVDIALKAALTGHLVFSTIHTNDAISTITRLQNMGTPDYLISAALTMILAQRLVRKMCIECKMVDENVNIKLLSSIGLSPEKSARAKIYKGKGCNKCNQSGYKGRMAIYEVLDISREIKQAILANVGTLELLALAKKNNFRTMQEMGHDLLLSGDLSFAEYQRVLLV